MADAATSNPTLGYSLHQKTTQLIEDFLKNILDNDFQYLDEILAEVKEHFGRRDSVALLPKTPCMKGKRKRIVRSLENSFENQQPSSSPDRTQDKLKDVCQTPESKKPAISPLVSQSPDDFVEPKGRVTRAKTNRARNGSENVEDSCTGKTRGRGAKKQLKGPKRQTRGKKNASKLVVKGEADNKEAKEATPKRQTTRNKRKQEETETLPTGPMKVSSNCNEAQMNSPVQCITKKSKLSVALPDEIPPYTEVFIPETPITECSSKKANIKKAQNTMSSPQVVLTPKSVAEAVQEISTRAIEEENKVISNPVVIVEARTYDNQENDNKNTPEPQEQAISESTVSSTKKTKRRTRSRGSKARYSRGMKRKQDDNDEDDEKNISSTTNNEAELEESTTKMQKLEQSDSDNAVVSSTVSSPVRSQRKSTRSSRASTRRSSRLSIKAAQNQRKTKIRKSRSLVKSSVLFKLSTKKMMPSLKPQKDNDSVVEAEASNTTSDLDELKTNLFEDQESNDIDQAEIVPEIREAQSSTPCKTAKKDSAEENSADEDVETEEEEFHDAHESIAEVDGAQFHDATETKEVNDDETEVVSRPTTRSSSRNQSRESQSSEDADHSLSSGSGSQGSSCKEGNLSQDCSDNDSESQDSQSSKDKVPFYIGPNRVIKNPAGVINSFIKRNTPKKLDNKEKSRLMKRAILEKQEKEKERIEQLELQKQRRIEEQKRKREEKEKKAAELRAARAREEQERREQMEKKLDMRKQQEERARKEKEKEEEIKRKVRLQKKAELDARRKQEEEQRQQKLQEKEEEARRHREMLRRKAEFEEQERQRKIMETKRQQELREQELEREREQEKLRLLREIEEKERKAKEEKEKAEKKMREEKEKEEKERKRIAQLLREKEESERKERERRAKEEKWRQERERKLREERERKLREEREVALQEELEKERQRQKKLEEQRLQEEARLRALHNADSYDMTPPPPPRIRSVASSENYNIDDICSDDSTDDEDAPRKRIPSWAQGAKLKAALINQSMGKFDVEAIFGGVPMPNLDEIFTSKKKKRFYQRTSSAHWDSPPLRTLNRGSTLI